MGSVPDLLQTERAMGAVHPLLLQRWNMGTGLRTWKEGDAIDVERDS